MNLFSKKIQSLLFLLGLLGICRAYALNLHGVYTSACQREIGLILKVDGQDVYLLNLVGQLKKIRPFEIIYLAYYPVEYFPIIGNADLKSLPQVIVQTRHENDIVELVRGWPLGYTKDEISFLTPQGTEVVIKKRNIFSLEFSKTNENIQFTTPNRIQDPEFQHPFSFRNCKHEGANRQDKIVYPQQTLSQPVAIKRELDYLRAGYELLERYNREQDFYSVPEVEKNSTALGMWTVLGSRYGASPHRTNNFTPILIDSYSSDIFDYQHSFVTGSAPMSFAIHDEPQTQFMYFFKASYFHFTGMFDPSLMLVGNQYRWRDDDYPNDNDVRLNDTSFIEMGFDFGYWSLQMHLTDVVQAGAWYNGLFEDSSVNIPRLGLSYTRFLYKIEAMIGSGTDDAHADQKTTINFSRLNLAWRGWRATELEYSLIYRNYTHSGKFDAVSASLSNALYLKYNFARRYQLQVYAALENVNQTFSLVSLPATTDNKIYPKGGAAISLFF